MKQDPIQRPNPPLYDRQSRTLILGSFPSVKSREAQFFYGHPQNRFWKVLAAVFGCPMPQTVPEKRAMLHAHHIALWDVIGSCDIEGSADSSIKNAVPNDLTPIFTTADIRNIYCNGAISHKLYQKHLARQTGRNATKLPSTSPANAAWSVERLVEAWRQIAGNES